MAQSWPLVFADSVCVCLQEVAGYTSGVHGLVVTASSFQLGSGVVLGLVDFGLLSEGWTVVVSFGATLAFASFNFFL